ncbi:hypothetical protein like AT5G19473 [Hibiscus trionum]|uniref:RIN4 pathogenic type III effector avirulence factor Avr cleavage site domain-containing protein n=1 Tax=Hibiscus trionum TaxID=183268 RepID=A0A9W7IC10_HIBTR|nr:hypothetical protein like AT5G19473 [Hibiscus trionum]
MSRPTENKNNEGVSIPRFGGWGEKGATNYSMVFLRARDKRKQCKSDVMHALGNDHAFKINKFLTYINRCIKP